MIALIAHNAQKKTLARFVFDHYAYFKDKDLIATEATFAEIVSYVGKPLNMERAPHGPMGGDIVVAAKIIESEINKKFVSLRRFAAVFFFRDTQTSQPHEPEVNSLMRVCDTYCIPLATNISTAELLIRGLRT